MLSKQVIKDRIRNTRPQLVKLGVDEIGLFGSYVREEAHPQSDIDLLVSFKAEEETFSNFMALCFLLEEVFQGLKVDVVTVNGLSPYIGPKILKEVVYVGASQ